MSQAQATFTVSRHPQLARVGAEVGGTWWSRLAARLIDELLQVFALLPFGIGLILVLDAKAAAGGVPTVYDPARESGQVNMLIGLALLGVGAVLGLGTWGWNRVVQQGRTGQSIGKAAMGISLVSATTGRPIGAWSALLREVGQVLGGFLVVGYLWPLWDRRKQTLADKVVGTVVARDARRVRDDEPTWAQRALG